MMAMRNGETKTIGNATILCRRSRTYRTKRIGVDKYRYAIASTSYDVIVNGKSILGQTQIIASFAEAERIAKQHA